MIITLIDPFYHKKEQFKGTICLSAALPRPLNRKNIIAELIRQDLVGQDMKDGTLITTPRNYFVDLLLSKNKELHYDKEQLNSEDHYAHKRLINLPFTLELSKKRQQYEITAGIDVCLNHFEVLQKLGEGTFSEIFLVERKYDRHIFCMKRINKAECRQNGQMEMISNQFQVLEYTSKYKIKLYYQFEDTKCVYFIVEYCPFGDVYSLIRSCKKNEEYKLTVTEKYLIWMQIVFGIISMHQKGLIYRDLKPENILIDEEERVKICDFGYTCRIVPGQKMNSLCGSYQYIAPEMIKKEGYNKSLDLYCLGLLFYELLVGSNPFQGITPKNMHEMKNKPINFEKKQISNTVRDLLKKLLKQRPEERLGYHSSLDILRHDFFKENEDLVHTIISGAPRMKSLQYSQPSKGQERKQLDVKEVFVFTKGSTYNYIRPEFDVTENVGPKFQSG